MGNEPIAREVASVSLVGPPTSAGSPSWQNWKSVFAVLVPARVVEETIQLRSADPVAASVMVVE